VRQSNERDPAQEGLDPQATCTFETNSRVDVDQSQRGPPLCVVFRFVIRSGAPYGTRSPDFDVPITRRVRPGESTSGRPGVEQSVDLYALDLLTFF
jgi:hypothetical protein